MGCSIHSRPTLAPRAVLVKLRALNPRDAVRVRGGVLTEKRSSSKVFSPHWSSLECSSPCQGEGRGSESRMWREGCVVVRVHVAGNNVRVAPLRSAVRLNGRAAPLICPTRWTSEPETTNLGGHVRFVGGAPSPQRRIPSLALRRPVAPSDSVWGGNTGRGSPSRRPGRGRAGHTPL